jgi:IS66 C-terminal element
MDLTRETSPQPFSNREKHDATVLVLQGGGALGAHQAKIHGVDPQAYLADILAELVNGWPAHKLDELLPWTWAEQNRLCPAA